MLTAEDAKLRAETLVSRWHYENRPYLGHGGGVDWQARKALIEAIVELLTEPGEAVDRIDDDAEQAQLNRRRNRGAA